ncbi:MAG TPA: Calx-beta domain-containing protein, partial [Woeseiaceae bacterium]|nr:Calx-beta domain-containing protein [Woeseiaceae bacterium]
MKHKLAPVSGAPGAPGADRRRALRVLERSIGFALILLAASSAAHAQVLVSVVATDGIADETPADNGEFLVQSTGLILQAIRIEYEISGSASPGDDYTQLSGEVMLNPGVLSQVPIAVRVPGNDNVFEGDETVTITLLEDDDYVVNSGPATVTILDSPHSVTASTGSNATENPVGAGQINVSLGASNESG